MHSSYSDMPFYTLDYRKVQTPVTVGCAYYAKEQQFHDLKK